MENIRELLKEQLVVRVPRQLSVQATRLVQSGEAVRVLPGVVALPEAAADWRCRALAVMRHDPDAVLTGHIAARLTFAPKAATDPITFATRRNLRSLPPGFSATRGRMVPHELRQKRGQYTITTPAMTALDLTTEADASPIDLALHSRQTTLAQIKSALQLTPNRPGNTERRMMVIDSAMEPWSEAERLLHRIMRRLPLPHPWYSNHWVPIDQKNYFIDAAIPAARIAIEADGYEFHSTREAFENDRHRQNMLVLAGWTVLRFTWRQLVDDPAGVGEQILRALRVAKRPPVARKA